MVLPAVRALRLHGRGDLRVDDVEEPPAGSTAVTVAVAWCGICGTDVHEYRDGPAVVPHAGRPHPLTGETLPLTLGHEIAGVVLASPDPEVPVGARVVVDPLLACGACAPCASGNRHLCRIGGAVGLIGRGGGFADRLSVELEQVHLLPDEVPLDLAALVEPLAVGWHAARRGAVVAGSTVLVVGAGPIGLGCLVAARAAGAARTVVAVRSDGARAALARDLGADEVVLDLDGARVAGPEGGFDVVLETAANPTALRIALVAVRAQGRVVDVGLWGRPAELHLDGLLARELSVVGSMGYEPRDFEEVVAALAAGDLGDVGRMITARVSLEDATELGFRPLAERRGDHVKVLVGS